MLALKVWKLSKSAIGARPAACSRWLTPRWQQAWGRWKARCWRRPRRVHGWSGRRRPSPFRLARSPRRFPRDVDDRRLGVEAFDLGAGDALVVGGDVFQLLQREHIGDDVVAVGRALFDHLHHLLGTVAAVEHHEI